VLLISTAPRRRAYQRSILLLRGGLLVAVAITGSFAVARFPFDLRESRSRRMLAELDAALLHNTLGVQDEKITGAKAKEYTDIILREAQMYMSGEQSLDDTVKNIKTQADKALLAK